jgi:hypothetical protein
MNVEKITSGGKQQTEKQSPPGAEATLRALPKVRKSANDKDSQTGVSTKNAFFGNKHLPRLVYSAPRMVENEKPMRTFFGIKAFLSVPPPAS